MPYKANEARRHKIPRACIFCVNPDSGEILASALTTADDGDPTLPSVPCRTVAFMLKYLLIFYSVY
jgi:hypothetical protein